MAIYGEMTELSPSWLALSAALLLVPCVAHAGDPEFATPPSQIVNGVDIGTCGYPTVVGFGWDSFNIRCSGVSPHT